MWKIFFCAYDYFIFPVVVGATSNDSLFTPLDVLHLAPLILSRIEATNDEIPTNRQQYPVGFFL